MRDEVDRQFGRDGFVLVAVLVVMALLSALLSGLSLWSRNSIEGAAIATSDLQMDSLLRSAATVAAYQLFILGLPQSEVGGQQLALNGGTATIEVGDDGGKVDLNTADLDLLAAAYRASGRTAMLPSVFAARVADWRDDDSRTLEGGAEIAEYRSAGLASPRNGEFRAISDLLWVIGIRSEDLAALSQFVTIFNPTGSLDPYKISPLLLEELVGEAEKIRLVKNLLQSTRTDESDKKLREILAEYPFLLNFDAPSIFRIAVKGRMEKTQRIKLAEVYIAISQSRDMPFHIIKWQND